MKICLANSPSVSAVKVGPSTAEFGTASSPPLHMRLCSGAVVCHGKRNHREDTIVFTAYPRTEFRNQTDFRGFDDLLCVSPIGSLGGQARNLALGFILSCKGGSQEPSWGPPMLCWVTLRDKRKLDASVPDQAADQGSTLKDPWQRVILLSLKEQCNRTRHIYRLPIRTSAKYSSHVVECRPSHMGTVLLQWRPLHLQLLHRTSQDGYPSRGPNSCGLEFHHE